MDTTDLQSLVVRTRAERGFTTEPLRILAFLTEELGEVAGELKRTWSPNYADFSRDRLADELGDTLVLLLAMADAFEIDLGQACASKLERDGERHWRSAQQGS